MLDQQVKTSVNISTSKSMLQLPIDTLPPDNAPLCNIRIYLNWKQLFYIGFGDLQPSFDWFVECASAPPPNLPHAFQLKAVTSFNGCCDIIETMTLTNFEVSAMKYFRQPSHKISAASHSAANLSDLLSLWCSPARAQYHAKYLQEATSWSGLSLSSTQLTSCWIFLFDFANFIYKLDKTKLFFQCSCCLCSFTCEEDGLAYRYVDEFCGFVLQSLYLWFRNSLCVALWAQCHFFSLVIDWGQKTIKWSKV